MTRPGTAAADAATAAARLRSRLILLKGMKTMKKRRSRLALVSEEKKQMCAGKRGAGRRREVWVDESKTRKS